MAAKSVVIKNFRTEIPGELVDGVWRFPTIWAGSRSGKRMYWNIHVHAFRLPTELGDIVDLTNTVRITLTMLDNKPLGDGIAAWYKVDSAYEGSEPRASVPTMLLTGKNAGRANATNVICQALRDALGLYTKQLKKAATTADAPAADACALYPPMLASVYSTDKPPQFPVAVQRKYDGIRTVACLCEDRVVLYSRNLNIYPGLDYLREDVIGMLRVAAADGRNVYLDGELYKHGVPLQQISGNGRRSNTVITDYNYMIYDVFVPAEPDMPYTARRALLEKLFAATAASYARMVETHDAADDAAVGSLYETFLAEGFEGAMVRVPDAAYVYSRKGYHSSVLLKVKPTYDAEFRVIDWETGTRGKAASAIMIICETAAGKRFAVTPAMEIADRNALAAKMPVIEDNGKTYFDNVWRDTMITVQYAGLSVDGVPLQPRTRMQTRVDEPVAAAAAAN